MSADRDAALMLIGILITCLVLGGLTVVVVSGDAAAQENSSALDLVTNADDNGLLAGLRGRVSGWLNARAAWFSGDETSASDACSDLRETFNEDNDTIETYVNNRTDAGSVDVLAVTCAPQDDDTATDYLVTDIVNDSYTNTSMVDETDRTVDEECVLEEDAAINAADELQTFVDEFAAPDEAVAPKFRNRLVAQYSGDVDCNGFMGVGS